MSKRIKRVLAMVLMLTLVFGMIPAVHVHAAGDASGVCSLLDSYSAKASTTIYEISNTSRIFVVGETAPSGSLLQTVQLIQRQFAADGYDMDIAWGNYSWTQAGDIVIQLDSTRGIGAEGYELDVFTKAVIYASDVDGLLYGANMFQKIIRSCGTSIRGFNTKNTPDTVERTVQLDVARKYFTKEWICNFIKEMSWMGYNTLSLHFSEDGGFRADLWDPAYYKGQFNPENDFTWICGSHLQSWVKDPYRTDADANKYLTTAELVEIINVANEYHIDIIPSFDAPSHMDYLTWKFEQNYKSNSSYSFTYNGSTYTAKSVSGCINYTGRTGAASPTWPYYTTIDINDNSTRGKVAQAFVFSIYEDIADFFKEYAGSTQFSIGADEVNLSASSAITWDYTEFPGFINEINGILNAKGYTMRMFNDFIKADYLDQFADNIKILYWNSPFSPSYGGYNETNILPVQDLVSDGRILYNCIQTNTYFVLRVTSGATSSTNTTDARSPDCRSWTFYHSTEDCIYNEWYPADISEHGDYSEDVTDVPTAQMGGGYFLIWNDYCAVATESQVWNGKDSSGTWNVIDRMWSNTIKMWNSDINNTVTYNTYASYREDFDYFPGYTSCSNAASLPAAKEPVSGYLGGCTGYASYCKIGVVNTAGIMSLPCSVAVDSTSEVLEAANSGDFYTATRLYQNTEGELWYQVMTSAGTAGYLYAGDVEYKETLTSDITLTGSSVPNGHVKGKSYVIRGTIGATYNTLTSVAVYMHSGFGTEGAKVTGASTAVDASNSYVLANSTVDDNTVMGSLPLGNHTYAVYATYENYYADGNTLAAKTGTVTVSEEYFVVIAAAVTQSSCSHTNTTTAVSECTCVTNGISVTACSTCGLVTENVTAGAHAYGQWTVTTKPTCTSTGVETKICSVCGDEKIQSVPMEEHSYTATVHPATCVEYERTEYICAGCGDSYSVSADELLTEWSEIIPEDVDPDLLQSKTQYRYSDYETVTSASAALDGYTMLTKDWKESESGTVKYVREWPAGFRTGHSLYTTYNKTPKTASETETTKITVNSDKISGYLYYHWCRGTYTDGPINRDVKPEQTADRPSFCAFYSTTDPSTLKCDTSDDSYVHSNSACCKDSYWYFVVPVYTQSYTKYTAEYTHECWTDMTEWSDTAVTGSDTRKVETRIMYRYTDAELGDHNWVDGACSVCQTLCNHKYQNHVCTICSMPKPVMDYYLFGYINGADYASEADAANLGEYKFVDGKLEVFFMEDSYVGIKSSDNLNWYMTDGWQGMETSSVILYNNTDLAAPDKFFVPGGMKVTFTLVDNGDDSYVLSYTTEECRHLEHDTDGVCTLCHETVGHNWVNGSCSCGLVCTHTYVEGTCSNCGMVCDHVYQNNICQVCGITKPVMDYYLFGYINGADYASEGDYANLGIYKFVDGTLVVKFGQDSYVGVKASDNLHWYMTDGWQGSVTSTTLYNTNKLTNADKLFVPGNREVTFTLVDNGDDTYVLSYVSVCTHDSHNTDGVCDSCSETVGHSYQNNICTVCGTAKPVMDYYLVGYMNGADYGTGEDAANLGTYKFVDGKVVAFFTADSYVAVKASDNATFYMTDGWQGMESTSVTLYNEATLIVGDKLFVPANMKITFTLVDNGDDTYVLSYVAEECPHDSHGTDGICTLCGNDIGHSYVDGVCTCGVICEHTYTDGVCDICGIVCTHDWLGGVCQTCGMECDHHWADGACEICTLICSHSWSDGVCAVCGTVCQHTYENNICVSCGMAKPVQDYFLFGVIDGTNYGFEEDASNPGRYRFVNGTLTVIFNADSYVAIKSGDNLNWYLADVAPGDAVTATLINSASIEQEKMLFIPGNMEVTFTLVDNGDDTYVLSYIAEEVIVPTLKPILPSLVLEEEIRYNIYFTAENLGNVTLEEMGLITFKSQMTDGTIDNADAVISTAIQDGPHYMVHTNGIPAKEMGDTIYFRIYAKLAEGVYVYSDMYGFSAVSYVQAVLKSTKDEALIRTCVSMLNYGAVAQQYFNYKTDTLVNAFLTEEQQSMVSAYSSDMVSSLVAADEGKAGEFGLTASGFSKRIPSVTLEGAFSINYYFTPSSVVEGEMMFYYWDLDTYNSVDVLTRENATGSTAMFQTLDGPYVAACEGIAAKEVDETIFVVGVYESEGVTYSTGVLSFSITAACEIFRTGSDANLTALAESIIVYANYAKDYFKAE